MKLIPDKTSGICLITYKLQNKFNSGRIILNLDSHIRQIDDTRK
ncbi:hypothetical protein ACFFUQ_19015 [Flavobacterium branchiarum]|uniref:Uncharacterized protein n=1 Tax=Flavobacterium branchiarum TaxID=1114870 RepID=A0ABV5FRD5_9FLAO